VNVIVIEPGAVTTAMTGRLVIAAERITSGMTAKQHGRYEALMKAVIAQAQTFTRQSAGLVRFAHCVSDRVLDSLLARALKRYLPGALPTPWANHARVRLHKRRIIFWHRRDLLLRESES
jgi:hypothetical protein